MANTHKRNLIINYDVMWYTRNLKYLNKNLKNINLTVKASSTHESNHESNLLTTGAEVCVTSLMALSRP